MPETPIRTTATVLEVLRPGLYQVALPNGKEVIAHLSKALRDSPQGVFSPRDRVAVEMTPYDFSKARITGREAP